MSINTTVAGYEEAAYAVDSIGFLDLVETGFGEEDAEEVLANLSRIAANLREVARLIEEDKDGV